jgi:hypothetical protein
MSPIVDPEEPFVPALRAFLEQHRDHGVSVRLVRDA